jgi:hypothetical protein
MHEIYKKISNTIFKTINLRKKKIFCVRIFQKKKKSEMESKLDQVKSRVHIGPFAASNVFYSFFL